MTRTRQPKAAWPIAPMILLVTVSCGGESASDSAESTTSGSDATSSTNPSTTSAGSGGSDGTTTGSGTTSSGASTTASGVSSSSGGASNASVGASNSSGGSAASGGASDSSASDTSSGGAAGGSGGSPVESLCPESPPQNGGACDEAWIDPAGFVGAHCAWGTDPRPECRVRGLCLNGEWMITEPEAARCGEPALPSSCPEAPAPIGSTCEMANLECWYDDGTRCVCSPCMGGSEWPVCGIIDPPEWACTTPDRACPNPLPNAGDTCEDELQCGLDCELPISCQDGVWQWGQNGCPICAAPNTPIATPSGDRPIASLAVGDVVYSVEDQAIVAVPIVRVGSTPVVRHHVVRVRLGDGSVLEISPGHPTADGRTFAELVPGSALDGSHTIVSAELVPYRYARTYDILPATASGTYFAAGALIGSTLASSAQP